MRGSVNPKIRGEYEMPSKFKIVLLKKIANTNGNDFAWAMDELDQAMETQTEFLSHLQRGHQEQYVGICSEDRWQVDIMSQGNLVAIH